MNEEKFKLFLINWAKEKSIKGKSFDDLFKLEDVPLGWFYRKLFLPHVVPKQVNTFDFIIKNKKLSTRNRMKFYLGAKLLKKYLIVNEKKKIRQINKIKNYSKEKKVLFLTYTNHILSDGKIFRIQDVVDEIKKDKNLNEFVLFADPLSNRKYKEILGFNNIYAYYDKELSKKAEITSQELSRKWGKNRKLIKIKYKSYLTYAFDFYFSREFLYLLVLHYEMFKKIIKNENVEIVVLTSQNLLLEKCALAAAKYYNIPTIVIQHGMGLGKTPVEKICPIDFAVFGKEHEERLIKWSIDSKKIHKVGPLIFDEICKFIKTKKKKERNVLIATGPFIEVNAIDKKEYFKRMKSIVKQMKKIDGSKIDFKLHPREVHVKEYETIGNKFEDVKIYGADLTRDRFYELIDWCDVFVHMGSSAAIEAMIIDRPIVTIDITGDSSRTYWIVKENVGVSLEWNENVKNAVEKALNDEEKFKIKRKKYVKDKFGVIDGKAYERIVKLIKEIIKNKKN